MPPWSPPLLPQPWSEEDGAVHPGRVLKTCLVPCVPHWILGLSSISHLGLGSQDLPRALRRLYYEKMNRLFVGLRPPFKGKRSGLGGRPSGSITYFYLHSEFPGIRLSCWNHSDFQNSALL